MILFEISDNMSKKRLHNSSPIKESSKVIKEDPSPADFPRGKISFEIFNQLIRFNKELGKGSYGIVYHATHCPTGKNCVVKIIPKKTLAIRGMALHEAHVGITVSSPNLCRTFAYAEDPKKIYIIMEYIEGMDLYTFIVKKIGIFQKVQKLLFFVIVKILQGIHDLHEAGFVHSDIKPENIFIGLNEDQSQIMCVKIIDFGLCMPISKIQGYSAGTIDFQAPEIAKDEFRNERIDIWSFGITLYAMVMMGLPSCISSKNPDIALRKSEVLKNLRSLSDDKMFNPFGAISTNPKIAMIQELVILCLTVNPLSRPTSQELLQKIREISPHFQ
jgi:serine/threonine protein kinase